MIIDGKSIAQEKAEILKQKISGLKKKPKLAIILIGDDPVSKIYVNLKIKKAQELGIETEIRQDLNTDADGIIVQLPGPQELIDKIPLNKDVDGLRQGSPFLPATLKGVLGTLGELGILGKKRLYVVVGQGKIGKPIADFFEKTNQVIRCNEFTKNLKNETLKGDVLVVATGVPNLIKVDMVKLGAVVIDCGSPKAEVDFENVKNIASAITPVPGGVGPMTVVSLLENVVEAAKIRSLNMTSV